MKHIAWIVLIGIITLAGCSVKTPEAEPTVVVGWRGDGTGIFRDATPPTEWNGDDGKHIAWKSPVRQGQSTPIVVGDLLFVTAEEDWLRCVSRTDGKILWEKRNGLDSLPGNPVPKADRQPVDPGCGYATATPTSDGRSVFASYGTGIVVCYSLDGTRQWVKFFDHTQETEFGRSASPVLVGGKLLLSIGHLFAVDPGTGEVLWEAKEAMPAHGTPVIAKIGDVEVVITPMGNCVRVSDGRILAKDLALCDFNSPVVDGRVVYFGGASTTAIELPETPADTIETRTLWENDELEGEFYASAVVSGGVVYLASNEGMLFALDTTSGETLFAEELSIPSGASGDANVYPSLAIAGGKIYLSNDAGNTFVIEAGKEFKLLAENELDEGSGASPMFAGGELYLRGGDDLYRIEKNDVARPPVGRD